MILTRVKDYLMFVLLYACSLYHFIFSSIAILTSKVYFDPYFILEYIIGTNEYKLRSSLLPVYGFETFSLMTCFMLFEYLLRKYCSPGISVRRFLDAYLFSQLIYVGFLYKLINLIFGMDYLIDMKLWLFNIPMFFAAFPLSVALFRKRLEKNISLSTGDLNEDNKILIFDYLVFWGFTLICASISYWLYRK